MKFDGLDNAFIHWHFRKRPNSLNFAVEINAEDEFLSSFRAEETTQWTGMFTFEIEQMPPKLQILQTNGQNCHICYKSIILEWIFRQVGIDECSLKGLLWKCCTERISKFSHLIFVFTAKF